MTDVGLDDTPASTAAEPAGRTRAWLEQRRAWLEQRGWTHRIGSRGILTGIVVVQAAWLFAFLERGWFSETDLARMADAHEQPLGWGYLTSAAGEHFVPAGRLVFWLMSRLGGLDWTTTVVIRVALAACSTVLLHRLLVLLVGQRNWLLAVVACYAFSPLLLPGIAWLTSGVDLVCAQVFVLLVLIAHVSYVRTGRWPVGVAVGPLMALALAFQEQSILTIPMLAILSLGFLQTGTLQERVRAEARRWVSWASLVGFVALFGVLYQSGSYNRGSSGYGAGDALQLAWREWIEVLAPGLVGGPWHWWWTPTTFVAYADPGGPLIAAGQCAFAVLLVLGFRATGSRAIIAWTMPIIVACGGVVLAGFGRFDFLGSFIPPAYRYSFSAAVPLALAVTLGFARTTEEAAAAAPPAVTGTEPNWLGRVNGRGVIAVAVSTFLALSAWSALGFDERFSQNGAEDYVDNLVASGRAAGPEANVYDSAVSKQVIPFIDPRHYVSDVLGLAGVSVHYDRTTPPPLVVRPDGRLGPAVFVRSADADGPHSKGCGVHIGGVGTWRIPLTRALTVQDWLLNLQTYQPHPADLDVTLRGANGRLLMPNGGSRVHLGGTLTSILLRLPVSAPTTVVVRSSDPRTTVCIVHTYVGAALPARS